MTPPADHAAIRARVQAASWQPEDSVPDVAAGHQERFIVAIRHEETDRVFVREAEYLNGVLLQWSDDHPEMNDDGEVSCVGWFEREPHAEFDDYYQPIRGKRRVVGWMPLPAPPPNAPADLTALLAERDEQAAEVERLRKALEAARSVLSFYADPPTGADTSVPDFYDELDFGSRAAEFLRTNGEGGAVPDHLRAAITDALRPFAWAGELMAARRVPVKCVEDIQPDDPDGCNVVTIGDADGYRVLTMRAFRRAVAALREADPRRYGGRLLQNEQHLDPATCNDELQVAAEERDRLRAALEDLGQLDALGHASEWSHAELVHLIGKGAERARAALSGPS